MPVLLQSRFDTQFVTSASNTTIVVAGILIVGFVLVLLIAGLSSSRRNSRSGAGPRKFRKSTFKRRALQVGLTKTQISTLDFVRERYNVKNPYQLLANSRLLDFYLGKAIQGIDQQVSSEDMKEAQKLTLYRIKQVIERNSQRSVSINNTKQLKPNQGVTLAIGDSDRYRSKVVAILRDGIAVAVPMDITGSQIRWKKWSLIDAFFWKSNGEGYSFASKLTGYNVLKGEPCAFLQHSNKIQRAKQRRFRRKTLDRPCYFYPVRIMTLGSGKNRKKKAFVETKRSMMGTVIEISAGGCSIRASRTLDKGALIKVDFETERGTNVASYGKVVGRRKENAMSTTMHLMFTQVSRKNLNKINSFIYEYDKTS